jgi:hypothetical protein
MPSQILSSRRCVLVLACVLLLSAGCKRAADGLADTAIERASGGQVKVDRDGDTVRLKTPEGEMTVQGGEALPLPETFPEDVYLPKDYAINSVMDINGMSMVSMRAPGRVPGLFADARKAMVDQGWKETMAMQHSSDSGILAFEKDTRGATLAFSDAGDADVAVSVQLSSKQAQ